MTRAVYAEDGGRFLVEVLSDTTVGDRRTVSLRCVKTLRPSPLCGSIKPGHEWTADCVAGYESFVGWELSTEGLPEPD